MQSHTLQMNDSEVSEVSGFPLPEGWGIFSTHVSFH